MEGDFACGLNMNVYDFIKATSRRQYLGLRWKSGRDPDTVRGGREQRRISQMGRCRK